MPETVTVSPVSAVAPASVQAEPCSTVSVPGLTVITGAVVSTTVTVLVAVPVLPAASVAVYVIVYVPAILVSKVPETVTVSSPSEVAPASVQVDPCSTVSVPGKTVITGAVVSALETQVGIPETN